MSVLVPCTSFGVGLSTARRIGEVQLAALFYRDVRAVLENDLLAIVLGRRMIKEVVDGAGPVSKEMQTGWAGGAMDVTAGPRVVAVFIGFVRPKASKAFALHLTDRAREKTGLIFGLLPTERGHFLSGDLL